MVGTCACGRGSRYAVGVRGELHCGWLLRWHIGNMKRSGSPEKPEADETGLDALVRSFSAGFRKRIRPRTGLLETWWERVLAAVLVALLMALVASYIVGAG
jgi:hypothetical protein